ncbi:MAG: efflux RND transporter periplasmic adaptor subunit [Paracoccaceae bacterium]
MPLRSTSPTLWRAALIIGALGVPFGVLSAQDRPMAVLVAPVERAEISDTTPVIARIVATVESQVASRTAGIVSRVLFAVGDRVDAGQALVEIDRDLIEIRKRTANASLEAARAGVEVAEARLQLASQTLTRQSRLQGSVAFSRGQYEDLEQEAAQARSELVRAQAQAAVAEAALARAAYDSEHATIRAPFSGVVIAKAAQPGAYIDLGEPAATLVDTSALEITADVPVRLVNALRPGAPITARFEEGASVEATVRSLLPVESASTRTRQVRLDADFTGVDRMFLASGRAILLDVPITAPRQAVLVPKDALVQQGGGWTVFTVEEGTATPRRVRIGEANGAFMEVISGLDPGEDVVVRGNERLRPGQPVTARPANPEAETAAAAEQKS